MKNLLILLSSVTLFVSCDLSQKENPNDKPTETEVSKEDKNTKRAVYRMADFKKVAKNCSDESCSEVTVDYPKFLTRKYSDKINAVIVSVINQKISDFILEDSESKTTSELAQVFLNSYADFKKNFPDIKTAWYINIKVDPTYLSDDVISLEFETASYSGGAHPNTTLSYVNINQNGKQESRLNYFFKKPNKIVKLTEAMFREQNGLTDADKLSEKGFVFDNDRFQLSEEFGFNEQGLVIHYNPYEISSYSDGPTRLIIPFEKLEGNFKF